MSELTFPSSDRGRRCPSIGFSPDTFGATRSSFSAITKIDRTDFGVSFNAPIPGRDNAMLLSNEVVLTLDVEAVLQTGANGA